MRKERKKISDEERFQIVKYWCYGHTYKEVAKKFDIATITVHYILKQLGYTKKLGEKKDRRATISFTIDKDLSEWLSKWKNRTEVINTAIRCYMDAVNKQEGGQ